MADTGHVQERILELRENAVLKALPALVLAELAHAVEVERIAAGETLLEEGSAPKAVRWLLEGRARWTRGGRTIARADLGSSIGLLEVLAGSPASASAIALSPARAASIAGDRLIE